MRVRATGSPGVTTVNAVQTTVKGEGVMGQGRTRGSRHLAVTGRVKRIKCTQRHGLKKESWIRKGKKRNKKEGDEGRGLGRDRVGNN